MTTWPDPEVILPLAMLLVLVIGGIAILWRGGR